ncbi:hypothetical protein B7P43_G12774 [Cryptotermes secundus]|uniref:Uncharacterized protein n=1 Tax=Cryptotermes secundus TaxID=105785 RepID=A0A2J7QGK8_9NEOP|nr:hypothetical protein B7P43_G12774 [Cryptotermes secundus]
MDDDHVEKVRAVIPENSRLTLREVSGDVGISKSSCLIRWERRKRPEGWRIKTWMLHHDNAPAHTSLLIREFLAFFLFPKLKSTLKGRRFQTIEELEEKSRDLRAIPLNAFQNWKREKKVGSHI